MQFYLAAGTSQAHLDGTTTGIVVMMAVMLPALAVFIGAIYWSARVPHANRSHRPATSLGSAGTAGRPLASARGDGLLVDHAGHDQVPAGS